VLLICNGQLRSPTMSLLSLARPAAANREGAVMTLSGTTLAPWLRASFGTWNTIAVAMITSALLVIPDASVAQASSHAGHRILSSGPAREKTHSDLLDFLRGIRSAYDAGAVADPDAFQSMAELDLLDWNQPAAGLPKVARSIRPRSPTIRHLLSNIGEADGALLHYALHVPIGGDPDGFVFSFRNIPKIACLSVQEVETVFGLRKISRLPRGMPTDGAPFTGPRWQLFTKLRHPTAGMELTLAYDYADEDQPTPRCLVALSISSRAV
jgi:hypothetical protein